VPASDVDDARPPIRQHAAPTARGGGGGRAVMGSVQIAAENVDDALRVRGTLIGGGLADARFGVSQEVEVSRTRVVRRGRRQPATQCLLKSADQSADRAQLCDVHAPSLKSHDPYVQCRKRQRSIQSSHASRCVRANSSAGALQPRSKRQGLDGNYRHAT